MNSKKMATEVCLSQCKGRRALHLEDELHGVSFDLGIEIGALESFFSFERTSLGCSKQTNVAFTGDGQSWAFEADLDFETAKVHVSERGKVVENAGRRVLSVHALERSHLMDSVLRFVIRKQLVKEARIGDRLINHRRRNKYHQFPLDTVELRLMSGATLRFCPETMNLPDGFSPLVYLRDEPDVWVLHFRALALSPSEFVLKGCTRLYNRPFPPALQQLVFSTFPKLRHKLLFVRERFSQRIPIQVNGAATIEKGMALSLAVHWVIEDE